MKGHDYGFEYKDRYARDCLFDISVSEGKRIVSYMIAGRANCRLSLLQPQLLFNCVFDGAVVLLLRSIRVPGLVGFSGVQQCYRKKGEEQGKGSGRLRAGMPYADEELHNVLSNPPRERTV